MKYLSFFRNKRHFLLLKAIKILHESIIYSNFARLDIVYLQDIYRISTGKIF